jgi:hypothetical protein
MVVSLGEVLGWNGDSGFVWPVTVPVGWSILREVMTVIFHPAASLPSDLQYSRCRVVKSLQRGLTYRGMILSDG